MTFRLSNQELPVKEVMSLESSRHLQAIILEEINLEQYSSSWFTPFYFFDFWKAMRIFYSVLSEWKLRGIQIFFYQVLRKIVLVSCTGKDTVAHSHVVVLYWLWYEPKESHITCMFSLVVYSVTTISIFNGSVTCLINSQKYFFFPTEPKERRLCMQSQGSRI